MSMKIHFQIEYITRWGENLYLCLNTANGETLSIAMDNNGRGIWFTDYEFNDEESGGGDVTYYYMVLTDGVITRREEGSCHTVPYIHAGRLVLSDRWKEFKGHEIEQRTVAIPYVRHNGQALWKGAGTAVPVFSLRTERDFGIGEFTDLKLLADWAAATGQSIIQTLPVNDTTMTRTWKDSYPYSANSSFALNPIYISLEAVGTLSDTAFLKRMETVRSELNALPEIDWERVMAVKTEYLDRLFDEFGQQCLRSRAFRSFFAANRSWLEPYAIYCYLRDKYGTSDFSTWKEKRFTPALLTKYCTPGNDRYRIIQKHMFVQYHLHVQFQDVKKYVNIKGILLKGDIPIGVNRHSSDVWIFPDLFHTDCQAGAPPDDFARDGQKWGMPTYNWDNMARDNYSWFAARFRKMADYYDAYRIDHLLGFFRIWEIPLQYSSGLMGRFNPARPYTAAEIGTMGFGASPDSFCTAPQGTPETNVLFLEDTRLPGRFHPRINGYETSVFESLPESDRNAYRAIHDDYFYSRNNCFWSEVAMSKLPALIEATDMIVCGEDLGMIPACVPEVMDRLRIMSLEVQRMPKDFGTSVADPATYPYMSVCTPSTHDMSVLRSWIEKEMPHNTVITSDQATTLTCREIIQSHLSSPSILSIFQIQDWMSVSPTLRAQDPDRERINVPANPDNYWRYRMHVSIGKLLESDKFNSEISDMIARTGR